MKKIMDIFALLVVVGVVFIGLYALVIYGTGATKSLNANAPGTPTAYTPAYPFQMAPTPIPTATLQPLDVYASNNPDIFGIYETLSAYATLRREINYTFDDTQLSELLANDPKGGVMNEGYLGVVRYMQGKPDLKLEEIGFLDYSKARWAFNIYSWGRSPYDCELAIWTGR